MQNIEAAGDDQRTAANDEGVRYITPNEIAEHNGPQNARIFKGCHNGSFGYPIGLDHEVMCDTDEKPGHDKKSPI